MSDAERFKRINNQCEHVAALIHQAESISDPVQLETLYRQARQLTKTISDAIRKQLSTMAASREAMDRAA